MSPDYIPLLGGSQNGLLQRSSRNRDSISMCKILIFLCAFMAAVYFMNSDHFWQHFEQMERRESVDNKATTPPSNCQSENKQVQEQSCKENKEKLKLKFVFCVKNGNPQKEIQKRKQKVEFFTSLDTCAPIDYDQVIKMNSHELPKMKWTYDKETGICEGKNQRSCLPKLLQIKHGQYFWTSQPNKIMGCSIKKNMSQVMQAILCFLDNQLKFLYSGKDLIRDIFNRGCSEERHSSVESAVSRRKALKENGWSYLAIVRDPIDRFLSGFIYMCLAGEQMKVGCEYHCHGCKMNMTCYLERQYALLRKMSRNPDASKMFDDPTEHSYPQSWRCDFRTHLKNYDLLHYDIDSEKFYPLVKKYLQSRNVSQRALDYIGTKMTSIRTSHATSTTSVRPYLEERLRSSSYLLNLILKMYYNDFELFGFELPEIPKN